MPQVQMRDLRIVRVRNGFIATPAADQFSMFNPGDVFVAAGVSDLIEVVQSWAIDQEKADAPNGRRTETA